MGAGIIDSVSSVTGETITKKYIKTMVQDNLQAFAKTMLNAPDATFVLQPPSSKKSKKSKKTNASKIKHKTPKKSKVSNAGSCTKPKGSRKHVLKVTFTAPESSKEDDTQQVLCEAIANIGTRGYLEVKSLDAKGRCMIF